MVELVWPLGRDPGPSAPMMLHGNSPKSEIRQKKRQQKTNKQKRKTLSDVCRAWKKKEKKSIRPPVAFPPQSSDGRRTIGGGTGRGFSPVVLFCCCCSFLFLKSPVTSEDWGADQPFERCSLVRHIIYTVEFAFFFSLHFNPLSVRVCHKTALKQ